jgi:transcription-repair coupling factor (superfamily II helicase)
MQHYRTCAARIGDLPVRVALLSRMVTKKQQKAILDGVANGDIDILIGTHRLFHSDIAFRDLGLLVIDEEHRFGVKHKEYLKELHPGLDVLSLSATPIPRSLSMALRGVRDISVIATPPHSRGLVFTVSSPWDQGLAYDAILRELTRGGQVYYLHNRVEDIQQIAGRLANRFPEHSVAIAHGQMSERELEAVMTNFYDGKIEILVCTTIIESGLDVPRANTLIVDDVRHLGLAQMHQIRGRIGRRSENAYALFFYSPETGGRTRERLEALGAVSGQSSGYQLAQRDLEIRGAGEILGTEQHGFKERIGYALYFKKLKERVDQLRDAQCVPVEASINLPLVIPLDYVPMTDLRIGLYRRLLSPLSLQDYDNLSAELLDRYGPLPEQVQGLLNAALIRGEGSTVGIERFALSPSRLTMRGSHLERVFPSPRWIERNGELLGIGGLRGLSAVAAELINRIRDEDAGKQRHQAVEEL